MSRLSRILFYILSGFISLSSSYILAQPFAYVVNQFSDSVSVIDIATNTVIGAPITVGLEPTGIAITPSSNSNLVDSNLVESIRQFSPLKMLKGI